MSKASLIYVSNDLIQAANKEFFNFIWKGKDKIKRFALINDIKYGGLKMVLQRLLGCLVLSHKAGSVFL